MEITVQTCQKLRKGWKRLPGGTKTLGLRQRQVQAKTIIIYQKTYVNSTNQAEVYRFLTPFPAYRFYLKIYQFFTNSILPHLGSHFGSHCSYKISLVLQISSREHSNVFYILLTMWVSSMRLTMTGEHFSVITLVTKMSSTSLPRKRKRYYSKFNNDWLKVFDFVHRSKIGDQYIFCTFCHTDEG